MALSTAVAPDLYPMRSSLPGGGRRVVKFVGGSAAITQTKGQTGALVTYITTGIVEVTFPVAVDFVGLLGQGFESTTASALAGYTCNIGVYNTTTFKVRVSIYNASNALADLAALQWLTLEFSIQQQG